MAKGTIRQRLRDLRSRVKRETRAERTRNGTGHISFAEPQPSSTISSSCGLRRVPTPFPVKRDDHLPGSLQAGAVMATLAAHQQPSAQDRYWNPGHISFQEPLPSRLGEGRPSYGLTRQPNPLSLRQADDYYDQKCLPGGDNDGECTTDNRRHALYNPFVDVFHNARRHRRVSRLPAETSPVDKAPDTSRYVRPLDFLCPGWDGRGPIGYIAPTPIRWRELGGVC